MNTAEWDDEKLLAFYELVSKAEGFTSIIPKNEVLQCWECLQVATSLNDLPSSSVSHTGLLDNHEIQSFFLDNPEFWNRLGLTVLKFPRINQVGLILSELVERICNNGTKLHEALLAEIWFKRDEIKMPLKTLERIIEACPYLMEVTLRSLLISEMDSSGPSLSWRSPKYSIIVKLASESANVFQVVTSIMNEVLIETKFNSRIISVIKIFIKGSKSLFKNNPGSFVSLYPVELQSLVAFLVLRHSRLQFLSQCDKDSLQSSINAKFSDLLNKDFKAFACLSTHFPVGFRSLNENEKKCDVFVNL